MNNEPHRWEKKDTLLSLRDVFNIARVALAECISDAASWVDTKAANQINTEEDES
jgi:negative regulator of sigma E activity